MARPHILSVGQCGYDHGALARLLDQELGAQVTGASTFDEALAALRTGAFDLVLVNRVTDADGSRGTDLIRTLKADPALAGLPVMLVSDYPQAQAEAVALGAHQGFGKSGLRSTATLKALAAILTPTNPDDAR